VLKQVYNGVNKIKAHDIALEWWLDSKSDFCCNRHVSHFLLAEEVLGVYAGGNAFIFWFEY